MLSSHLNFFFSDKIKEKKEQRTSIFLTQYQHLLPLHNWNTFNLSTIIIQKVKILSWAPKNALTKWPYLHLFNSKNHFYNQQCTSYARIFVMNKKSRTLICNEFTKYRWFKIKLPAKESSVLLSWHFLFLISCILKFYSSF